jgi:DNA-binding transcriptional regulator YhcF (GntR family)
MGLIETQRNAGRTVTMDEEALQKARSAKAQMLTQTYLQQMDALGLPRKNVIERLTKWEMKEEENGRDS